MKDKQEYLLVSQLKDGSHTAFDALFEKYFDRLLYFSLKMIKNRESAEEIVQDVFVKVWQNRAKINQHYSFKSFLFSITYNTMISALRKQKNNLVDLCDEYPECLSEEKQSADHDVLYNEKMKEIDRLIGTMPYMRQKIFRLSRYEGLSYSEIASKVGISKNTVENHMSAALKYLRHKAQSRDVVLFLVLSIFLG